jgi:hypothetical protein
LLGRAVAYLNAHGWGTVIDSGWSGWDLEVGGYPWMIVQVCTTQEDHGSGRHMIRVRYCPRPSRFAQRVAIAAALCTTSGAVRSLWLVSVTALALMSAAAVWWWLGTRRASKVIAIFDLVAASLNLVRYEPPRRESEPVPSPAPEGVNAMAVMVENDQ